MPPSATNSAKHETTIGDRAFVGSNSSVVAPITIGDDAFVAAGSVVTKPVPPGALTVERSQQVTKEGWVARRRARRPAAKTPAQPATKPPAQKEH